jgi:hypothetical membrane protein
MTGTRLILTLISTGALIGFALLPFGGVTVPETITKTFTDLTLMSYAYYFAARTKESATAV